jgi:phospholipase/lecithinase/hemolysin
LVSILIDQVIDLHTQLSYFKKVDTLLKRKIGEAQAKKLLSKAIYLFSIGTNDYFAPFLTNTSVLQSYSHEEYVDMVIGNVTTVIEVITVNVELIQNLKQTCMILIILIMFYNCALMRQEIHRKGGRKFGFLSLAPLGFVPITKAFTPENREELTALVTRHNKAFSHALQILASQLKGFKYSYINLYSLTTERMNNPLKYGMS